VDESCAECCSTLPYLSQCRLTSILRYRFSCGDLILLDTNFVFEIEIRCCRGALHPHSLLLLLVLEHVNLKCRRPESPAQNQSQSQTDISKNLPLLSRLEESSSSTGLPAPAPRPRGGGGDISKNLPLLSRKKRGGAVSLTMRTNDINRSPSVKTISPTRPRASTCVSIKGNSDTTSSSKHDLLHQSWTRF
jgi:hypothetical protein